MQVEGPSDFRTEPLFSGRSFGKTKVIVWTRKFGCWLNRRQNLNFGVYKMVIYIYVEMEVEIFCVLRLVQDVSGNCNRNISRLHFRNLRFSLLLHAILGNAREIQVQILSSLFLIWNYRLQIQNLISKVIIGALLPKLRMSIG